MQTTFAIGSRLLKGKLERLLGRVPKNKRDDLLGWHFAGTPRVLARPQPIKVEAGDVAAGERSREQAGLRFPSPGFRTVTPYRSPSGMPSP